MKVKLRSWILIVTIIPTLSLSAQGFDSNLKITVPEMLAFIPVSGKSTAYYEIHVTNLSTKAIKLSRLMVVDARDSSFVLDYDRRAMQSHFTTEGRTENDTSLSVAPHGAGVIYVELVTGVKIIKHRITYEVSDEANARSIEQETHETVCHQSEVLLGPPLRGGPWVAIYDPAWPRGHRRVFYRIGNSARIPGRYAIDFMKVDHLGKVAIGDQNIVRHWLGYAAEVLAVADGVVASIRNDFPESATLAEHPRYTGQDAAGNFVSLDLGSGCYAFYEHLKPFSITVKQGDRVKKGQVIALLGFTGSSTGPHLHFHVADTNSTLGAEGIPFILESFENIGFYPDFEAFGKAGWSTDDSINAGLRKGERPSKNSVIHFR